MIGAVLTTLALLVMPNSPTLWIAAGTLWVLDASINVSMEPFRAFVGDQLAPRQRLAGYAMQSFFIGVGAIVASFLPFILAHFGVANTAAAGTCPTPCAMRSISARWCCWRRSPDSGQHPRILAGRAGRFR